MRLAIPKYEDYLDYSQKIDSVALWKCMRQASIDFGYSDTASVWFPGQVMTIPEYKFMLWDYVKEQGLLEDPEYQDWAIQLLQDKTIFAYEKLRWEGKPIKLYPYQDAIINDKWARIDMESANQIGKSLFEDIATCESFLEDHGIMWMTGLISKSKPQNNNNMRNVRLMLENADIAFTPGDEDSMSVTSRNVVGKGYTNTIICGVASTSSLGFPFNEIYLDEYEFWDSPEGLAYLWDQVLKPRMFATKGKATILSNPNGENFVSQDLQKRKITRAEAKKIYNYSEAQLDKFFKGKLELPEFHVYNFDFRDKPGNSQEEFEKEKKQTHAIIFASTMAAQRVQGLDSAISESQIRESRDSYLEDAGKHAGMQKNTVFFLDVGHVHDQSVLTGLYTALDSNGQVEFKEFYKHYYPVTYPLWRIIGINPEKIQGSNINVNDGWESETGDNPSIRQIIDEFSFGDYVPVFGADITGNEAMIPLLNVAGISCEDIHMSGPWKAKWYGRLIGLLAQHRYKRGKDENMLSDKNQGWEFQARKLQISTKMPDGRSRAYPLYHHETENDLDDALDSTIGALSLIDNELDYDATASVVDGEHLTPEQLAKLKEEGKLNKPEEQETDEEFLELMTEKQGFEAFEY
jgi:hypothetical protein